MVGEVGQRHHSGVVDQDVDGAELVDRRLSRGLELRQVGHIDDLRDALTAGGPDSVGHLPDALGVDVDGDHLGPAGGALLGDESAEAAGGPADDDDLAGQMRHLCPSC